ncbi:hypothetical protein SAM40697_0645 [Streptomyces ambofaciens]|uniref:Lipoprotein n=1 Tax=Streptomyces ambofaciens TaxID=1889 RepID=A0ABN4P024_STRAM|nr:hypothetical protein [Streptomyces ambofaciens]ANB04607.1 hypothetical protein SAM40697_0645 [Streptomyces ambofaciens]
MRTTTTTAVLTCLLAGLVAGCGSGGGSESADEMLEDANAAMRALKSVRIDSTSTAAQGGTVTVRLVTDLKSRCTAKATFSQGGSLEQIRTGETDYVRPDRAYLESRRPGGVTGEQRLWIRTSADAAQPGDGLSSCTRPFASFGTAEKGKSTRVGGREAVELTVSDEEDRGGKYTFSVATQGEPHLLKVVYEGADYDTSTSFTDFDEPLDVRPPKSSEVIDGQHAPQ